MPNTRKPYPPKFREQMVALVRAGRTPEDLAREFEPTAQSISNWVAQADRETGRRTDGLTTTERAELTQLRRENRQLKLERENLVKSRGLVRIGDRAEHEAIFGFMKANQATYPTPVRGDAPAELGLAGAGRLTGGGSSSAGLT